MTQQQLIEEMENSVKNRRTINSVQKQTNKSQAEQWQSECNEQLIQYIIIIHSLRWTRPWSTPWLLASFVVTVPGHWPGQAMASIFAQQKWMCHNVCIPLYSGDDHGDPRMTRTTTMMMMFQARMGKRIQKWLIILSELKPNSMIMNSRAGQDPIHQIGSRTRTDELEVTKRFFRVFWELQPGKESPELEWLRIQTFCLIFRLFFGGGRGGDKWKCNFPVTLLEKEKVELINDNSIINHTLFVRVLSKEKSFCFFLLLLAVKTNKPKHWKFSRNTPPVLGKLVRKVACFGLFGPGSRARRFFLSKFC